MSDGIVARLRAPLAAAADLREALTGGWVALGPGELAGRRITVAGEGQRTLGDLFDLTGTASGSIRFEGDLRTAHRLGAGLAEGTVMVEGSVGDEVGLGMSGGTIDVRGSAGNGAGGAAAEARRGMTGGELIVRGSVGTDAGARMRRGLLVVGGDAGQRLGAGTIAGTAVVFGDVGDHPGLWSKRGTIIALGPIAVPSSYRYACTYRPAVIRLLLIRLRAAHALPVRDQHLAGPYRRYSGDLADLGKGELLAWTAE